MSSQISLCHLTNQNFSQIYNAIVTANCFVQVLTIQIKYQGLSLISVNLKVFIRKKSFRTFFFKKLTDDENVAEEFCGCGYSLKFLFGIE